jgi:hypothetical protein
MRKISARQREQLERTTDDRHGLALTGSQEEVRQLTVKLEEEEYQHLLEKEALILRGNHQKIKDKEAVKQAEEKGERLNALVQAAEMLKAFGKAIEGSNERHRGKSNAGKSAGDI